MYLTEVQFYVFIHSSYILPFILPQQEILKVAYTARFKLNTEILNQS